MSGINRRHLNTILGGDIEVLEMLGQGGQGMVYKVLYNGEPKALKWYKPSCFGENANMFYENIRQNIMKGAPSKEFLWPIDMTNWTEGTFGYVMNLKSDGYYEITEFMLCHQRFRSYKAIIDAALHIVLAFRLLHNSGYSYQDLNDGNFFINPENGSVLICDNDNVAPDGRETGIIGKPRYMAPEIVLGENKPNSLSDRFSMSVIIYMLFCLNHPLEGKKYLVAGLSPALQKKLYGSEPLFMMDKEDQSNGPDPVIHQNSIIVWKCLPKYMREIFMDAFSQKALRKPTARPKEVDWMYALTRFRSEIVECDCGNEVFTKNGKSCNCESCGRQIVIKHKLKVGDYSIPAIKGSRIYRCQIGVCDADAALGSIAQVIEKKNSPGVYGIKNKSNKEWKAITTKGTVKIVKLNDIVPLKTGIKFQIEDQLVEILENE